jgi:DNA-binding NarL/FixJ family response regulator
VTDGSAGPPAAGAPAAGAAAGAATTGDAPVRVVVSDDHPVVRQGLRSYLEAQGFEVVAEAADGAEAVEAVRRTRPDVLLTDLVMAGVDGIEAITRLRAGGPPVGILVLTSFSGAEQVIPAIRAGADGYLLKDAGPEALARAIRAVHRGEPLLGPEAAAVVMARVAGAPPTEGNAAEGTPADRAAERGAASTAPPPGHPDLDRLTAREREVLAGLGRGLTNRELAAELFVSEKTVKTHVSSVLAKLRVPDRTRAALFAVRVGLVDPRR